MSETKNLVLGDLKAGDELPPLGYDVTATTVVLGALATRDWRPMHHDYDFAVNRNGVKNIFINTPNQAAWFERYLTDWTGPKGRMGRIRFRMKTLRRKYRFHRRNQFISINGWICYRHKHKMGRRIFSCK